ncbi:hypothetical protein V3C99_009453 [Haemonchus contortus]
MLTGEPKMGGRKMWMWFHTHVNDTLLFKDWWIQDAETMVWSCCIIVVLAIGLEAMRWLRWAYEVRRPVEKTWWSHLSNPSHYTDVAVYVLQTVMAYLLMLVFMTFSVWLCLSLCIGLAIGHYLFGTRRFKTG